MPCNAAAYVLQVRRTLQRAGGTLQFVEPKTASSLRVLVIPKLATIHLERHRARQDEEAGLATMKPSAGEAEGR
jgi:hypothetical protein